MREASGAESRRRNARSSCAKHGGNRRDDVISRSFLRSFPRRTLDPPSELHRKNMPSTV